MNGNAAGFTLLEVVLALTLIFMVLMSAAPMFVYASRVNSAGADIGSATALAEERMENLRRQAFSSLLEGGSLAENVEGYSDASAAGFEVRWRIVLSAGVKRIDVRAVSQSTTPGPTKEALLSLLRSR